MKPNVGAFVIEQRLRARVECGVNYRMGKFSGAKCSPHVGVPRAPEGKLDALFSLVGAHDLTKPVDDRPWFAAIMQRQQREGAANGVLPGKWTQVLNAGKISIHG